MQMAVSDAKALALPPSSAWWRKQQPARSAERAEKGAEQREDRLDEDGDRAGRRRIEDAEPAAATLTPFAQGAPRLRRLKGMARTHFATWMARELTYRADADPQLLVTGAQLPAPLPTSCRALRDLLAATCPTEEIDGETWLEFLTKADDVDSDEDSDEEDQDQ